MCTCIDMDVCVRACMQAGTSALVFRRADGEPSVAFLAHGRALLGTRGTCRRHPISTGALLVNAAHRVGSVGPWPSFHLALFVTILPRKTRAVV